TFSFSDQPDAASYKQLGNGVNIPAVYHVLRALVERDADLLTNSPELVLAIQKSADNPDKVGSKKLIKTMRVDLQVTSYSSF
ncbi:MAG: hypothetical protein RL149_503, partial [Actinomycetota bacterium]